MEELTSPRKGTTSACSRQQRYCNARFDNLEDVETGNKATDKEHRHGRKIRNEKRQQVMSSPPITPFGRFSNQSLIQCYAFHEVSTYTLSTRFSPMLLVYPYASTNSKGPLLCLFWGLLLWCNSSMSQCARAKRNILNHVLIREHQQGFLKG